MERNMIALWILAGVIVLLLLAVIAFAETGVWVDSFGTSDRFAIVRVSIMDTLTAHNFSYWRLISARALDDQSEPDTLNHRLPVLIFFRMERTAHVRQIDH
jgi:hypothetical protein